jgi:acyl carrier protein
MAEVATKVMRIISGHLGIGPEEVVPEASLVDDLGADSLDTVELVIAFETSFGVEIPQADVERIRTVQDAINYVEMRIS